MTTDTLSNFSEAERKQDEILRCMTPARRLEIARELYETAWNLKWAGVKRQHPEWPDQEIFAKVRRIFLTGYAGA